MAETIYFNDGSMEVVTISHKPLSEEIDDADAKATFFENILREKLGSDAALFFHSIIKDYRAALSGLGGDNWERIADGNRALCQEAMENFEVLCAELDKPRINKAKLQKMARLGYDALHDNL